MNFPKFWAQGRSGPFTAWRWSNTNPDEARAAAAEAAVRLAEQFRTRGRLVGYGYSDRPLREPVLREIHDGGGEVSAVITRNSYGCEVLNTARAMFVDVDLPENADAPPRGGLLGSLFGKSAPQLTVTDRAIGKAEAWTRQQPLWNWRIYRTRSGLRLLATHTLFDPADSLSQTVFDAVDADPLYRKLCKNQQCFRARLTPKPWRCGMKNPPVRWPFADAAHEHQFGLWDAAYQTACRTRATCRFLRSVGSGEVHQAIEPLIALHDEATRATSGLSLA